MLLQVFFLVFFPLFYAFSCSENLDRLLIAFKLAAEWTTGIVEDERFDSFVRLRIPIVHAISSTASAMDLSMVFGFLESNTPIYEILSYSVSQATLEQIFLQVAKKMQVKNDEDEEG